MMKQDKMMLARYNWYNCSSEPGCKVLMQKQSQRKAMTRASIDTYEFLHSS
jgi:hypothetical protein